MDWVATERAWSGTAFDNTRNIVGSLSFLVVVLFLFEGFCKMVIGENEIATVEPKSRAVGMRQVLRWLREKSTIASEKLEAIEFLNAYRNAWHAFGEHDKGDVKAKGLKLVKGQTIPTLTRAQSIAFLGDLLDVFIEIDDMRADRQ